MSSVRRHDLADRANLTDEATTFNKPSQTVDKPHGTVRDIHEQYMKDPPHNLFKEPTTHWSTLGAKEGAREETEPQQEGVLGEPGVGKPLKENVMEDIMAESSVYPGNPPS